MATATEELDHMGITPALSEAIFKSEVVRYACNVYKSAKLNSEHKDKLGKALVDLSSIGPEAIRELADNLHDYEIVNRS